MPSQLPTGIQVISRVYQSVKKAGKDRIEEMLGQAVTTGSQKNGSMK
jgi:hypothetical protein